MTGICSEQPCPCQSGLAYEQCCKPCHEGIAPSAEALMRSRYSAFVNQDAAYLLRTWHTDTRPPSLPMDGKTQWFGLTILSSEEQEDDGVVSFRARFCEDGEWCELDERSIFKRLDGQWYYVDGNASFMPMKLGRNDPCPCGSGSKWKKCCG